MNPQVRLRRTAGKIASRLGSALNMQPDGICNAFQSRDAGAQEKIAEQSTYTVAQTGLL